MRTILARVTGFTGTNPGPASGLRLIVTYQEPGGGIVRDLPIKSSLWKREEIDADARPLVGVEVVGFLTDDGILTWHFLWPDALAPCAGEITNPPPLPVPSVITGQAPAIGGVS